MARKTAFFALALVMLPLSAMAQERQTYDIYAARSFDPNTNGIGNNGSAAQPNEYRTYPGRESYGENYGYIPRHPGDFKDAVDRGQWEGGGGYQMPKRSYSGY